MGILERVFPSTLIFTILLYKGGVRMSLFSNNKFMVLENSDSQKSELFGVESMSSGHASDAETYSFTNESFDFVVEYTREYNTVLKEFYKNILESNDNQEIINESFSDFFSKVVGEEGLEPSRHCCHKILSLACLPVPPLARD